MNHKSAMIWPQKFCLLGLVLSSTAFADIRAQIYLESGIQDRVQHAVHTYDSNAKTNVRVNFRKVSAALPGTGGLELKGELKVQDSMEIQSSDIDSIEITVSTFKETVPDWLKDELKQSLRFNDVPVRFVFKRLPTEVIQAIQLSFEEEKLKNQPTDISFLKPTSQQMQFELSSLGRSIWTLGLLGLGLLAGIFLIRTFQLGRFSKQFLGSMGELIKSTGESSTVALPRAQTASTHESTPRANTARDQGAGSLSTQVESLRMLPLPGLITLFSDCYWSELDGYASWIWSVLTPELRRQIISSWPRAIDYARSIAQAEPEVLSFHQDVTYLRTERVFENLSNTDISSWLQQDPGLWACLSPIRQMRATLTLKEKLQCLSSKPQNPLLLKAPAHVSIPRQLTSSSYLGSLTLNDELQLLKEPEMLDPSLRSSFPTLVWFALVPLIKRQSFLANLTAEEIASAWIGPEPILKALEEALPEKKVRLVHSYIQNTRASRQSDAYVQIFAWSLRETNNSGETDASNELARAA